jgi:riboflavin kinase/FMN adenylyltransferase
MSIGGARFQGPRPHEGPAVVAIGVFDGLHLGHRAILERALDRARTHDARCVVVSFDPHPEVVLRPGSFHWVAPLTPLQEKRERLLEMGVDELHVIPFTRELAGLEPEAFVHEHLTKPFRPLALVVGQDFALGRGRSGNVQRLTTIGREVGFEVEAVPLLEIDGARVSSTRIRELLAAGRVDEASRLLGRRYSLTGTVVTGHGVGRTLGFPTANVRLHEEKLVPADGIYAVWVKVGDRPERHAGAMSIGVRPTFGGRERQLEVFVLDWSGDLVGGEIELEFVDWLRSERRFETAEALIEAMREDVAETRRRLGAPVARPLS